ncbi:MAG: hypothetical protein ACR2NL_12105 [Acidimicrobiia bacterium]
MGTSIQRTTIWLAMAVLAIAGAAWFGGGVSAAPGIDAGAPPSNGCDNGVLLADPSYTGAQDSPDCVEGNVREGAPSCLALGFPDAMELNRSPAANASDAYVSGTLVGGGLYLDITAGSNVNVLGAVIKGATDANLYWGDLEGLHSPLSNAGSIPAISHWTICYDVEEKPESARATLSKVGPPLEFGFAVSCSDGTSGGLAVKGGDSTAWTFDFDTPADTVTCTIAEEQLTGWTTTIGVTGADSWSTGVVPDHPSTEFTFGSGDDVAITFTNVAEYLSVPPTGQPPVN